MVYSASTSGGRRGGFLLGVDRECILLVIRSAVGEDPVLGDLGQRQEGLVHVDVRHGAGLHHGHAVLRSQRLALRFAHHLREKDSREEVLMRSVDGTTGCGGVSVDYLSFVSDV